ncbi:hypothetical protein [Candidatus Thiodiazotropha endoloripes]|nr:hypothetical protein [Candidatus Thiodiazotropha endoloripes]
MVGKQMKTTPVLFDNRDGYKLYGIFEQPEHSRSNTTVLLLSPGVKMRVGPHRLYNKLSKQLVEHGVNVFRFDFFGLGDSEGVIEESVLKDVYNTILDGRFIGDTVDAMNWLETNQDQNQFILGGLCGGALTGLLTACEDERVTGLLTLGLINVFEGGEDNFGKFVTEGQLSSLKDGYIKKLTDLNSWKRLLTFKSDFRVIFKILLKPLRKLTGSVQSSKSEDTELAMPKALQGSNVNPKFAPSFFKMLKNSKKMLLIFSGADRLLWEFEEKFENIYKKKLKPYKDSYQIHTIPEANHILASREWEASVYKYVSEWLTTNYPNTQLSK